MKKPTRNQRGETARIIEFDQAHFLFLTPHGFAGLSYCADPFVLRRVFLPLADEKSLKQRMELFNCGPLRYSPLAEQSANSIVAYFNGDRIDIPWQWLNFNQFTALQAKIYQEVARIPYGHVRSYGQIAAAVDSPGAARFVGRCMATNPYPVLIPCHRVIRTDGSLGGFGGGLRLKQRMLDLEKRG